MGQKRNSNKVRKGKLKNLSRPSKNQGLRATIKGYIRSKVFRLVGFRKSSRLRVSNLFRVVFCAAMYSITSSNAALATWNDNKFTQSVTFLDEPLMDNPLVIDLDQLENPDLIDIYQTKKYPLIIYRHQRSHPGLILEHVEPSPKYSLDPLYYKHLIDIIPPPPASGFNSEFMALAELQRRIDLTRGIDLNRIDLQRRISLQRIANLMRSDLEKRVDLRRLANLKRMREFAYLKRIMVGYLKCYYIGAVVGVIVVFIALKLPKK